MPQIDFASLRQAIFPHLLNLLHQYVPEGTVKGGEYMAATLEGGRGKSFRMNLRSQKWADFATGDEQGGDFISYWAKRQGIQQHEAAQEIAQIIGYELQEIKPIKSKAPAQNNNLGLPPEGIPVPDMTDCKHGAPTAWWEYGTLDNKLSHYVARYDFKDQDGQPDKLYMPFSWSKRKERFIRKALEPPRLLYNAPLIKIHPKAKILLVEGEKSACAALVLIENLDQYIPISWQGGANAIEKADWSLLYGREVILWPDADEPGIKAMQEIGRILKPHCEKIGIISPGDKPEGWDAADAVAEDWDWNRFTAWCQEDGRLERYEEIKESIIPQPEDEITLAPNVTVNIAQFNLMEDPPETPTKERKEIWEQLGIARNTAGAPIYNTDNVLRCIEGLPYLKELVWFDGFRQEYRTLNGNGTRQWVENDYIALMVYLQRTLGLSHIKKADVMNAVHLHGMKVKRHETQDWLHQLEPWDQKQRIDDFFCKAFGLEESTYYLQLSHNFWLSLVARIENPGCKVDNMVVLEGPQGILKSTAFETIVGPDWFAEASERVTKKDFFIALQGKLIVEVSELESFYKSDIFSIKRVISCKSDRYRALWEKHATDHPRQCIFVGTANDDQWGRDDTGARRFWPVQCQKVDIKYIKENRLMCFTEALAKLKAGESWWLMPEVVFEEQEKRRQVDPWESVIEKHLATLMPNEFGELRVNISDILFDAIAMDKSKANKVAEMRVATILKNVFHFQKKLLREEGIPKRIWVKSI